MKVYNYNQQGELIGESIADKSPLENDVYLVPANATYLKPPKQKDGYIAVFDGAKWTQKKVSN